MSGGKDKPAGENGGVFHGGGTGFAPNTEAMPLLPTPRWLRAKILQSISMERTKIWKGDLRGLYIKYPPHFPGNSVRGTCGAGAGAVDVLLTPPPIG